MSSEQSINQSLSTSDISRQFGISFNDVERFREVSKKIVETFFLPKDISDTDLFIRATQLGEIPGEMLG